MPARSTLVEPLLAPIAGENPSGRWVRDDPVYEQIKEARREEVDADQGKWQRARKVADPALLLKLAGDVIATQSKDLQLTSWWTEALLKRDGLIGLRDGVAVMRGLLERFWPTLYPALEDGDASMRAGPLDFIALKLIDAMRMAPVNSAGHTFRQYEVAELAGSVEEARDDARRAAREALDEKKEPLLETVLLAIDTTPLAWYQALLTAINETIADVQALDAAGNDWFGEDAPSYRRLLDMLEQQQHVTTLLLTRRSGGEPAASMDTSVVSSAASAASGDTGARPTMAPQPTGDADAASRVVVSARFMRRARPSDPVPYALLRALRWGALRPATPGDAVPEPSLLEAPATAERARLKSLMLDQQYEAALDAAEELLGATTGGAWLDAQRFAVQAAAALGGDFASVHHVMLTALRQLLITYPGLPQATLLDDSSVANSDTQAWLEREGLLRAVTTSQSAPLEGTPQATRRPMLERARAEAAGGRLDKGVALLMADLARERSDRARFLRRIELVTILLDGSRADIAMPIVEEMLEQLDAHKLDTWEDGAVVAQALVLACRAIDATDGDARQRSALYLRVCRLDPIAALTISG